MKPTLLTMVQEILSSIDGDEVNSIGDTVESQQVALIIRAVFRDFASHGDLSEHFGLINLDATDVTTPTLIIKPGNVDYLEDLQYNNRRDTDETDHWVSLEYMEPQRFLSYIRMFDLTDTVVGSYSLPLKGFTTKVYYKNNIGPTYWTSFDDSHIVVDSYDADVDAMIQTNKTSAYAKIVPGWSMVDSFVPDLDEAQFSLLINESKAYAWAEIKQTTNQKAEKKARQGWIRLARTKQNLPGRDSTWHPKASTSYGR